MDDLFESAGAFGRYQKLMIFLTGLIASLVSICTYASVFVTGDSKLTCFDKKLNVTAAFSDDEKCKLWSNMTNSSRFNCDFDKSLFGETIITEFNLICDRQYLASITQTILILGSIFSLFIGSIGDYYGRRRTTLAYLSIICLNLTVFEILVSSERFSLNTRYLLYTIGQFLLGFQTSCCYSISYILLLELTTAEYRTKITSSFSYSFVMGEVIVLIAFYFTQNWQLLQWFMIIYSVSILILVYTFLSESPQWLMSVQRHAEAQELLLEIGRMNNKKLSMHDAADDELKQLLVNSDRELSEESSERNKLTMLFYPMNMLLKTLCLICIWNALNIIYYGITFGITSLNVLNPYLMFFLSALAEACGAFIYQINDIYGRRKTLILFLLIASVSCLIVATIQHKFLPDNQNSKSLTPSAIILVIFVLFGKMVTTGGFNIIYMYTSELYSTNIRNTALQFLACFGGFGSFIAPQINYLRVSVWEPLPYIIFSISALVACVCVTFLSETRRHLSLNPIRIRLRGIVCSC